MRTLLIRVGIGLGVIAIVAGAAAWAMLASSLRIRPAWQPGHQALYRFEYRGEGVYQPAALFSGNGAGRPPQRVYTAVSGTLIETVLAENINGATVVWNIADPHVRYLTGSSVDPILGAQLRADIELPYATRVGSDGRIESVAPSPDASQLGPQFMRAALGGIQFVAPDPPAPFGLTWTVAEPDTDGARTSTYSLSRWIEGPFGDAKIAFTRATVITVMHPATSVFHRPDILGAGQARGVWRLDGTLASIVSTDARNTYYGRTLIARSQSALAIDLDATATLEAPKVAASLAYAQARLSSPSAGGLHVEPSDEQVAHTAFADALGSDDEQTLSARLIDATRRGAKDEITPLAQKFAALFYLHPQTIAAYEPVLRRARSDSIPFDVLAAAFQQAGTPAAQSALAGVAELRAREPHAGASLVIGFGFLQHPIPRVDSALEYVVEHGEPDAADSAELALGSVAGVLADVDDARAQAIVARIEQRLAAARDDDARSTELLALGNAHAAGSLHAILAFQNSPSADVRSAVATALRNIQGKAPDDALRSLLSDPEPSVRLAAASAFDRRSPSAQTFAVLLSALRRDPSADVRASAVGAVWNARAAFPVAQIAVRAAANDREPGVRSAADYVLAGPSGSQERPLPPDVGKVLLGSAGLTPQQH